MASFLLSSPTTLRISTPQVPSRRLTSTTTQSLPISLRFNATTTNCRRVTPISASLKPSPTETKPNQPFLTGPTRTATTVLIIALTLTRHLLPIPQPSLPAPTGLLFAAGSLFFAALKDRPSGYLNTPLTVVAAGLAKWLDIYSGVLMVRVLLSWFPNIPWDRQPLSAIRDLCDPYLNLFRNIIPPIFDTLDVSPLLAFAVLGTLGSILNSTRGMY